MKKVRPSNSVNKEELYAQHNHQQQQISDTYLVRSSENNKNYIKCYSENHDLLRSHFTC